MGMEAFVTQNPGAAVALLALCGTVIAALAGLIIRLLWLKQKQEVTAWQVAVQTIADGLHDVKDSIDKSVDRFERTFSEVFKRLGSAEKDISHIKGRCERHSKQ